MRGYFCGRCFCPSFQVARRHIASFAYNCSIPTTQSFYSNALSHHIYAPPQKFGTCLELLWFWFFLLFLPIVVIVLRCLHFISSTLVKLNNHFQLTRTLMLDVPKLIIFHFYVDESLSNKLLRFPDGGADCRRKLQLTIALLSNRSLPAAECKACAFILRF